MVSELGLLRGGVSAPVQEGSEWKAPSSPAPGVLLASGARAQLGRIGDDRSASLGTFPSRPPRLPQMLPSAPFCGAQAAATVPPKPNGGSRVGQGGRQVATPGGGPAGMGEEGGRKEGNCCSLLATPLPLDSPEGN